MKHLVQFGHSPDYSPERLRPALESVLAPLFERNPVSGKSVLLKPNLLSWRKKEDPACVHPAFLLETVRIFRDAGASKIAIMENPAVQTAPAILRAMGLADELKKLNVATANFADYRCAESVEGLKNRHLEIAAERLRHDCVVDIAKAKTHGMMELTLCVKNLFGFVNGADRIAWHLAVGRDYARFADMLLDLYLLIRPTFNLADAVVCMEGNGPGSGTPTERELVAGSDDALALDCVLAPLLGAPDLILLRQAEERGLLPEYELSDPLPSCRPLTFPDGERMAWNQTRLGVGIPPFFQKFLHAFLLPRPRLKPNLCIGCGLCARVCPPKAIDFQEKRPMFRLRDCIRCFCCQELCPEGAIERRKSPLLSALQKAEKFARRGS